MATTSCPHCGEPIDTYPDPGGGSPQEYIEDCSVCCRAIAFFAVLDEETGDYTVDASADV